MCRLFAMTELDLDPGMRSMLFESLLVRSMSDDNQVFGTGVTDGRQVYKSGRSGIMVPTISWITKLDPSRLWFGHLRKPSKGMDAAATAASHPFLFEDTGLIGVHNGFIADVVPDKPEVGKPYVDSYYAFQKLNELIAAGEKLSPALIERWIGLFGAGSEYTMMLNQYNTFYLVRGVRPMYSIDLNGGRVYATSYFALVSTIELTEALWPSYFNWGKKVYEIHEHTLVSITGRHIVQNKIKVRVPDRIDPTAEVYYGLWGV